MRVPHEKYLLYLLITKHTDKEIIGMTESYRLPQIGNEYIYNLRKFLRGEDKNLDTFLDSKDDSVLIKSRRLDLDYKWLSIFDLVEAHDGSFGFDQALSVFSDRRKRNTLNIYLLCTDLMHDRIAELYENKFNELIPEECMDMYKKYFFNFEILNDADWQQYIGQLESKIRLLYESAPLRKSKYVQWKMGDEVHLDPSDVSSLLMTDFFFLAQDAHLAKADDWEDKTVKFAGLALNASDRALKNKRVTGKNMQMDLVTLLEQEEEIPAFEELEHE
jgi:hypothetical protein